MNEDFTERNFLKSAGLEHLNQDEISDFNIRGLDKETMAWAVWHVSECAECCGMTAELTEFEIKEAIIGSKYENLVEEIIEYYFETMKELG